jgi:2-polyprenyl-3-methyl-5-hydroxy-6-metoxy-1,4-benzoquinol methylase
VGYVKEKYTREYFLCQTGKPGVGAAGMEYFNQGKPYPRIVAALDEANPKGKVVLDIGFGRGEALKYCLEQGATHVYGVDFSPSALHIARGYLDQWKMYPHLHLYCEDILSYLDTAGTTYDLICMFDVLEHIPRAEVNQLMPKLHSRLNDGGTLIITTPHYKVDCDVISDGVKEGAEDSSDTYPETQGMHCNRYTRESLRTTLSVFGFSADDLLTIWYKEYSNGKEGIGNDPPPNQ